MRAEVVVCSDRILEAPDVLCGKREQGQVPGALDGCGQTTLVLGARAGFAAGLDLASLSEKAARR
jgi:hypothetical protein